jgi:hypothetical protein
MAAADQMIILPKQNYRVVSAAENSCALGDEVERSGGFFWTRCDRLQDPGVCSLARTRCSLPRTQGGDLVS